MAIPSGSGSEVLNRHTVYAVGSYPATQIDWAQSDGQTTVGNTSGTVSVPTDTIITILTVSACNTDTGNRNLDMYVTSTLGNIYLFHTQVVAPKQTFVWNDKFVLYPTDKLVVDQSDENILWHITYIKQDWT